MKRANLCLTSVVKSADPPASDGLIFAIRTDDHYATKVLKKNLLDHLKSEPQSVRFNIAAHERGENETLDQHIENTIHDSYRQWTRGVLQAMADCLDYERYGITDTDKQNLTVHFYDADRLAGQAVTNAAKLPALANRNEHDSPFVYYISLDEMIADDKDNWGEISFSRLFPIGGKEEFGYVARPGKKPINEQLDKIAKLFKNIKTDLGAEKIPFVLLEDNVRKAKMLNWVIDLMDKHGIFEHGELAGISTCFVCADEEEKKKIQHDGKQVPVVAVVDYSGANVDVSTPRDLMFDGFVVEIEKQTGRLPGIFMDVERMFKIRADKTDEFQDKVREINKEFCDALQDKLGVEVPLSWFAVAGPISHVTGQDLKQPMAKIMATNLKPPKPPQP